MPAFGSQCLNITSYRLHRAAGLSGGTSLHFAAQHGHAEVIAALIKAGAVVNQVQFSGFTPGRGLPPDLRTMRGM